MSSEVGRLCHASVARSLVWTGFGLLHRSGNEVRIEVFSQICEMSNYVWTARTVANFVRERRLANKMSQNQLAILSGVGRRFIVDLEKGKSTLQLNSVNAVLAVFGKTIGFVDAPRPETLDDWS